MFSGRLWAALAVVGVMGFASSAQAVLIDSFTEGGQSVNQSTSPDQAGPASSIFGEYRDIIAQRTTGSGSGNVTGEVLISSGQYRHDTGTQAAGRTIVQWDGDDSGSPGNLDATGLSGLNLEETDPDGIFVDVSSLAVAPGGALPTITFDVYTDETNWSSMSTTVSSLGILQFPFGSFDDFGGGADFGNVSAVQMTVDTSETQDADVTLSLVESATIPAPAALPGGLALMGMLGVTRYRRRRVA